MATVTWGMSERGKKTLIYKCFEYWKKRENKNGETIWRCSKRDSCKCNAALKTVGANVVAHLQSEHTHSGNVETALARKAVGVMKQHMTETIATPSSSQAAVVCNLAGHVQMALPQRATLSRTLRRHRQVQRMVRNGRTPLPTIPTDKAFAIPEHYQDFLLHDSTTEKNNILVFSDRDLLSKMAESDLWIADGTFKVVPHIFYQLYTIHFQLPGGINPAGLYALLDALLENKTR